MFKKFGFKTKAIIATISTIALIVTILLFPKPLTVRASGGFLSVSGQVGVSADTAVGEVTSMRTLNSRTDYLGSGKYSLDTGINAVHYKDTLGQWQNIDNSIISVNGSYAYQTTGQASFLTQFTRLFNAGMDLKVTAENQSVSMQPYYLDWTSDNNNSQFIAQPQAVNATVTNPVVPLIGNDTYHQGNIKWDGAYGTGTHFEWTVSTSAVAKLLTIDNLSNLPAPNAQIRNKPNPVLRLTLFFLPSTGVNIYIDGQLWDKRVTKQTFDVVKFNSATDNHTIWGFDPLMYWDSSGNNTAQSVSTLRWTGAYTSIEIRVPYSWLQTAVYPIFIDTTIDVQVGASADDGYASSSAIFTSGAQAYVGISGGVTYGAFFRLAGITIVQSATIDVSYLSFYEVTNSSGTPLTKIYGDNQNDPTAPTNQVEFANITKTTASVDQDGNPTDNSWWNTNSINSIVQELVNTYDYSNEHMQFVILNDGGANGNALGVSTWDKTTTPTHTWGAKLHIEYSAGSPINYSANQTSYAFGIIQPSSTTNTSSNWILFTNTSSVSTNISVQILANPWTSSGTGWTHSDSAAGVNTVAMKANSNNGTDWSSSVFIKYSAPYNRIGDNISRDSNYLSGLSLLAPTSFNDGYTNNNTIQFNFVSSAP